MITNIIVHYFFFQAEDGIRDRDVTGVQTCALPISRCRTRAEREPHGASWDEVARLVYHGDLAGGRDRRVRPGPCRWLGREGKARWTTAGDLGRPCGLLIGGRIVGQPRLGRSVGVHDIDLVVSVSKTHERDLLAVWGPTWLEFN